MKRPLILLGAVVALLAASAPAQAAKPSCTRGGAKAILTSGDASVVYVARPVKKDGTVLPEKFYGCWNPTPWSAVPQTQHRQICRLYPG